MSAGPCSALPCPRRASLPLSPFPLFSLSSRSLPHLFSLHFHLLLSPCLPVSLGPVFPFSCLSPSTVPSSPLSSAPLCPHPCPSSPWWHWSCISVPALSLTVGGRSVWWSQDTSCHCQALTGSPHGPPGFPQAMLTISISFFMFSSLSFRLPPPPLFLFILAVLFPPEPASTDFSS